MVLFLKQAEHPAQQKIRKVYLGISFILLASLLQGQSLLFPGDYFFETKRQCAALSDTNSVTHTSLQPYVYDLPGTDTLKKLKPGADKFFDLVFYRNLVEVRHIDRSSGYDRKFNLNIAPILNLTYGKDQFDTTGSSVQTNTRGLWISGQMGKKLIFETAFLENQSFMPMYMRDYINATGVVPGQGRVKAFKKTGYDYASAYGILHYQATKNFYIRLGHGKQKIGNGYRSLLLSDNSFNYPYVQFTASFFKNKLQYSQTYALLMNLTAGGTKTPPNTERIFQKKAATFQHLSWRATNFLNVYAFQGMIWKATDSSNLMHLDPLYANPVIFTNLIKYGFNKQNHSIVGGGFQLKVYKTLFFYHQSVYDGKYTEYSSNGDSAKKTSWGMQNGLKYYDMLGVKGLFLQAEANNFTGQPYVNAKYPAQDYSHYNQLLTTPALLPNEFMAMASYYYKRFFVQVKENYFTDNHSKSTISYLDMKAGYMINPAYNLTISAGLISRTYNYATSGVKDAMTQILYISLRTSIYNLYYDF